MLLGDLRWLFDFNFRLLNNILCINACLCKWKVYVKAVCMCTDIETIKHLIYEWATDLKIICLSFDIKWKRIKKGFCLKYNTEFCNIINNI